jgi:hypothetical protein
MNIYQWLLTKLNLWNYLCMLHLLRLMRNTIHNNGVYYHRKNLKEIVSYNGKTFRTGKRCRIWRRLEASTVSNYAGYKKDDDPNSKYKGYFQYPTDFRPVHKSTMTLVPNNKEVRSLPCAMMAEHRIYMEITRTIIYLCDSYQNITR